MGEEKVLVSVEKSMTCHCASPSTERAAQRVCDQKNAFVLL